jgi:hypothetical protein
MERRVREGGRARPVSRSAPARAEKRRGDGRKEEMTGRVIVSAALGKRKRRVGRRAAAGGIDGPASRLGQKVRR